MPAHEELARFLRRFNRLRPTIRLGFIAAALHLAEDPGDRGLAQRSSGHSFDCTSSAAGVWSISVAGQYRAVFHLGEQQRPGHAHIVWEFIGTHTGHRGDAAGHGDARRPYRLAPAP